MFKSFRQKTNKAYHNLKKKTPFKLPFMTTKNKFDRISKEMDSLIKRDPELKELKDLPRINDGGILTEDLMYYIPNQYLKQWDNDLIFNLRIQNHRDVPKARRYRKSLQTIMRSEKDQVQRAIKQIKQKSDHNLRDDFHFNKYYKNQMTQDEKLQAAAQVIKEKGLHKKYLKDRYMKIKEMIIEYLNGDNYYKLFTKYLKEKQFPELKNYYQGKSLDERNEEFLMTLGEMWGKKLDAYFKDTFVILDRVVGNRTKQTQKQRYNPVNYQMSTD